MNFLIGVCGIGSGHCTRQMEICKKLIEKGHNVKVLTYNEGVKFFSKTDINFYEVYVPIILYKGKRVDYIENIKRNYKMFLKGRLKNKKIYKEIIKNFKPDICISDYEPNVAKISYKINKPLINIDQQSKFIYMTEDSINGFSCIEEKKRMKLFFPRCNKKYIVSFYNIESSGIPENVEIVPPIIREDLKKYITDEKRNKVVVYFSKFIDISIKQSLKEIIEIFKKFNKYDFYIYTSEIEENHYNNIYIKKKNRENFIKDLGEACCAISTAGHTLISEAIFCGIPTYVIPLPTFDQNYCGKFINENNIGYSSLNISSDKLKYFLNNLEIYKDNIKSCKKIMRGENPIPKIITELEKKYENCNEC